MGKRSSSSYCSFHLVFYAGVMIAGLCALHSPCLKRFKLPACMGPRILSQLAFGEFLH